MYLFSYCMADLRLTRQQIYDRIRESSKEDFILEEMKRLGFWGKQQDDPTIPEILIKKETALNKELDKLVAEKRKYENKQAVLKEMRLKRMAAAKEKRTENKKKREQKSFEKAEVWRQRKAVEILYLGEHVSKGLNNATNNESLLTQNNLRSFENEMSLAKAMNISLSELKFLSFSRKVSTVNHYRKFYLPKKSGGKRLISAPMPRLKSLQYWILENVLGKIKVHPAANGFIANKSIVTNARLHIAKDVVINADVKDFFPSVHFKRVKGVFVKLGYSEKISTILSLICTESATEEVVLDGKNYFVQRGGRVLPQGAPTSPVLTNILCYKLDIRLQGIANKYNYSYTRYADDITFSGNENIIKAEAVIWRIKKTLQDEGFTPHPDKIRIMRKGNKQEVTGVVVNKKLSIDRNQLRKFRAFLHTLQTKGADATKWGSSDVSSAVTGYVNYIKMIDPVKAKKFQLKVDDLFRQQKLTQTITATKKAVQPKPSNAAPKADSNKSNDSKTDEGWWKVT